MTKELSPVSQYAQEKANEEMRGFLDALGVADQQMIGSAANHKTLRDAADTIVELHARVVNLENQLKEKP